MSTDSEDVAGQVPIDSLLIEEDSASCLTQAGVGLGYYFHACDGLCHISDRETSGEVASLLSMTAPAIGDDIRLHCRRSRIVLDTVVPSQFLHNFGILSRQSPRQEFDCSDEAGMRGIGLYPIDAFNFSESRGGYFAETVFLSAWFADIPLFVFFSFPVGHSLFFR